MPVTGSSLWMTFGITEDRTNISRRRYSHMKLFIKERYEEKCLETIVIISLFQIELKVGDVLGVAGNHWDGSNKGRNHRTNKVGLYPEFKTRERLRVVTFPTYDKVEL